MGESIPRTILTYAKADGKIPYDDWVLGLKDTEARTAIGTRLSRVKSGNLGDCSRYGPITELRIDKGPGYRVYIAEDGPVTVVLLAGGDKSSQDKDFKKANEYWEDYLRRKP